MSKALDDKICRVLDANFNRAKEGLRVCEDICRFIYDWRSLTKLLKDLRHDLTAAMAGLKLKNVLIHRNIQADVGKASNTAEMKRACVNDIMYANLQRVKESVRVLEEFSKLSSVKCSGDFKKIRYSIYQLEYKIAKKFSFY